MHLRGTDYLCIISAPRNNVGCVTRAASFDALDERFRRELRRYFDRVATEQSKVRAR